ncbi:hypothetical protein HYPDE_25793 [Hyphomicrobium denitrificans 1NES1]|uniref:Uncharacterized protein n=1 Tax=Hyphomicrobium denitrificans 1NES1 TaxID=670307 RepID=N0B1L2_9HYPH|nr:hypothetical protein HYPDE_25793 [Hyphomicrobium denitrificans 1NES1]
MQWRRDPREAFKCHRPLPCRVKSFRSYWRQRRVHEATRRLEDEEAVDFLINAPDYMKPMR